MGLKNILIVVSNIEKARKFYEDVFSLSLVLHSETNCILTEGLVLQEKEEFKKNINKDIFQKSNNSLLFFEEYNLEKFLERLNYLYPDIEYVNKYKDTEFYSLSRFYDLDGNLIEVRENKSII